MNDEIIHLAGPVITFGSVSRQRCSWCGALIDEKDITNIAVLETDRASERRGEPLMPDELAWWEVGGLVAVTGSNPRMSYAVDAEESKNEFMPDGSPTHTAPERCCMRLFEGLDTQT